jgi:surface protein
MWSFAGFEKTVHPPPIKKMLPNLSSLSICSTADPVGHAPKIAALADVSDLTDPTDAPGESKAGRTEGGGSGGGVSPPVEYDSLTSVFDRLVLGNRAEYAVDLPTDAPAKIEALQAYVLSLCASGKEYNRFCRYQLPTYLKPEVRRIQRDVLPRLRAAAEAKLNTEDDWMIDDMHGPFSEAERQSFIALGPSQSGGVDREKIPKTLRDLEEWDVWDVLSRRNGMPELKDLGLLENATVATDLDGRTYYNIQLDTRLYESVTRVYVPNNAVMTMLAHIWGVETWATRHMVVFQPVEMYTTVFNVMGGGQQEVSLVIGPNEAWHGPVEAMDVSHVTHMNYDVLPIGVNWKLTNNAEFNLPIGAWNVSRVTTMEGMFILATTFNQPIGAWKMSNVKSVKGMFGNATSFNQPIGGWDVGEVENMAHMFTSAQAFNQPIGGWDVGEVENMAHMFTSAQAFNQPIGGWDVSKVKTMRSMFRGALAFNQPIGAWKTSNVTTVRGMFDNAASFNQPIGDWNVSEVTDMSNLFRGALAFNQPIGAWKTSNVTTVRGMFNNAASFNQPIGDWNVSEVTDMSNLFRGALAFNQPIGGWKVSKVKNMLRMFRNALAFDQPIGGWDVSKVTNMSEMFYNTEAFNQPIGGWDVSNVTAMVQMFMGAKAFNQPIGEWDASIVTDMSEMFYNAEAFNQPELSLLFSP